MNNDEWPKTYKYETTADRRYKSDSTFRTAVDILRSFLQEYRLTPSELREAVVLAATMHEMTNIRPLFIRDIDLMKPPAMFGGNMTDTGLSTHYPGPLATPKIEEKK